MGSGRHEAGIMAWKFLRPFKDVSHITICNPPDFQPLPFIA
jgi:hypothetical protein